MQSLRKLSRKTVAQNESVAVSLGVQTLTDPSIYAIKPKPAQIKSPIRKSQIRYLYCDSELTIGAVSVPSVNTQYYPPILSNYALDDRHCDDIPDGINNTETPDIDWRQRLFEAREKRPDTLVLDDISWDVPEARKSIPDTSDPAVSHCAAFPLSGSLPLPTRPPPYPPPAVPFPNVPSRSSSLSGTSSQTYHSTGPSSGCNQSPIGKNIRRRAISQPRCAHENSSSRQIPTPNFKVKEFSNSQKLLSDMSIEELREQLDLPPGRLLPNTIVRIRNRLAQLEGPSPEELERIEQIKRREMTRKLPDERDWLENMKPEEADPETEPSDQDYIYASQATTPPRPRKFSNPITQFPKFIGRINKLSLKSKVDSTSSVTRVNRWANTESPVKCTSRRSLSASSRPQHTRSNSAMAQNNSSTTTLNSGISFNRRLRTFGMSNKSASSSSVSISTFSSGAKSYSSASLGSYGSSKGGSSSTSLATTISSRVGSSSSSASSHSWVIVPKDGSGERRGKATGLVRSNSIHGPSPLRSRIDNPNTRLTEHNSRAPITPPRRFKGPQAGEFGQNIEYRRVKFGERSAQLGRQR